MTNASSKVPPLYIRGQTSEVHEVANGFLFCHMKPLLVVISSLTRVHKLVKVEGYGGRLSEVSTNIHH